MSETDNAEYLKQSQTPNQRIVFSDNREKATRTKRRKPQQLEGAWSVEDPNGLVVS